MCLWTEKLIAEVGCKGCIGVCQAKEAQVQERARTKKGSVECPCQGGESGAGLKKWAEEIAVGFTIAAPILCMQQHLS